MLQALTKNETFKQEVELPLRYHGVFAIVAVHERKTVNELLVEILTNDPRIKAMSEGIERMADPPDGDFGIRPASDSALYKYFKRS